MCLLPGKMTCSGTQQVFTALSPGHICFQFSLQVAETLGMSSGQQNVSRGDTHDFHDWLMKLPTMSLPSPFFQLDVHCPLGTPGESLGHPR